jgi:peptide/nickel transport system permease protein
VGGAHPTAYKLNALKSPQHGITQERKMAVYKEKARQFSVGLEFQPVLDAQDVSPELRQEFENHGMPLSQTAAVSVQEKGKRWSVTDRERDKTYTVSRGADGLTIADGKSKRRRISDSLRHIFGFGIVSLLCLLCILATFGLTPHDPDETPDILIAREYQPPLQSMKHLLGTDHLDRDIFSRLIAGVEPYFLPGLAAALISVSLGVLLGIGTGFYGGPLGDLINIFVSAIHAFPRLVLFLLVMAILGAKNMTYPVDIWCIMGLLGLFNAPKIATLVEGKVHALKQTDFIEAARALGLKNRRIIWYHIIVKNCLRLLLVQVTYGLADAILVETTLSYLNVGVDDLTHASWGNMVFAGKSVFFPAPEQPFFEGKFWVSSIPAVAIMIAVLGLHQAGDSLNRILEER